MYNYKQDINKNIFRGYDIRGVYPTEIDRDTAYTIGRGFGSYIKSIGKTEAVVGHDNRLSSDELYEALITGI
ncbi:MAG: phosphomannomutase, partial [Bacilli bacterium]|nr:phosphomannomutase [Bacilli bacterium]